MKNALHNNQWGEFMRLRLDYRGFLFGNTLYLLFEDLNVLKVILNGDHLV